MLLEFSCTNHKSIKEKITFSMIAGKDKTRENQLVRFDKHRILRNAVIYGANGSGKSNFLDAVSFVKHLVVNSINNQPGIGIQQSPHKLAGISSDSVYSLQFLKNDIRYAFGFTLKNALVVDEYLYYFPQKRPVKIYERDSDGFSAGVKFKGKFDTCKDVLKPNRLMISCAANFSAVEEIEKAFCFFRDDLVIYSGLGIDNWLPYSIQKMSDDPEIKNNVVLLMQSLGVDIKDIRITKNNQAIDPNMLPPFLADEFRAALLKDMMDVYEAKVVYNEFEIELNKESTGIQKLFGLICPLVDILSTGKVLLCDEIEAGLHEAIVYGIIKFFSGKYISNCAQMIMTTHDTSILDLDIFRRDQVWFTQLKEQRATDLYSLAEIRNVRKDENIVKGYISGKYGAIPMLNSSLIERISEEV